MENSLTEAFVDIGATCGLVVTIGNLIPLRRALRRTTLMTAWNWTAVAVGLWTVACGADLFFPALPTAGQQQLWYWTAVVMLCPLLAVLGARRPVSRVWSWFVLLPLLLVLGWPALVAWTAGGTMRIELPMLLGYGLVLVMGVGNYWSTRFAAALTLAGIALILLVLPISTAAPAGLAERGPLGAWATLILMTAVLIGRASARRKRTDSSGFNRLWLDFRDWFGIVWARRILLRVNDRAEKENWSARLEMDRFVWLGEEEEFDDVSYTRDRAEHTFRWLLRRFVEPEWIDERLGERCDHSRR